MLLWWFGGLGFALVVLHCVASVGLLLGLVLMRCFSFICYDYLLVFRVLWCFDLRSCLATLWLWLVGLGCLRF